MINTSRKCFPNKDVYNNYGRMAYEHREYQNSASKKTTLVIIGIAYGFTFGLTRK
ncbi:unnamed protein product [Brugia timori]|uniref:Conserved domain protein n=1 Tax=Brugia timori TaxID=42155 RepID=A0A0R3R1T7_9BILA|nr:unnamed protein product [Brugia timori]